MNNSAELALEKVKTSQEIDEFVAKNKGKKIILTANTTKGVSPYFINKVEQRYGNEIQIKIISAYDDDFFKKYPHLVKSMGDNNIYTLYEIKRIVAELERIESGINPEWDNLEKLIYFIGQIKNKIIYHPFYETAPSKSIRSLVGLFTNTTVCAGYSIILKELCDRNGIDCRYCVGSCNKKDAEKNKTSHAWNIVKLNDRYVPIDLTWNANKTKLGHIASYDDLANINKFIESHYPCTQENIQNYSKNLKSIEGEKLREIDFIVNKDVTYDSTVLTFRREDKTNIKITLVGEHLIGGEYLYKYVYQKQKLDGTYSPPAIIYSQTNLCKVSDRIKKRKEVQQKLESEIRKNNISKITELKKLLDKTKVYEDIEKALKIMLSKENLEEAYYKRKDCYIGKIVVEEIENTNIYIDKKEKEYKVKGVFIDKEYAKKIPYMQKIYQRKDGTSFVVESFGTVTYNGSKFNKYRIYEGINSDSKRKYRKNTIFTDINEDLIKDNRPGIADDFLSRSRLDRKVHETSGYLGYYSQEDMRTSVSKHAEYFKKDLYKVYRLRDQDFVNYFETITFEEMQRLIKTYEKKHINNKTVYVNRYTNKEVNDLQIKEHLDFSYLWYWAAAGGYHFFDEKMHFSYAFNTPAKEIFEIVKEMINENIEKTGEIDPTIILKDIKKKTMYKHSEKIIIDLFTSERNAQIVNNIFKKQNPTARRKTNIKYFDSSMEAYNRVSELERKNQEIEDMIIEVKNKNGNIVFERNNKK